MKPALVLAVTLLAAAPVGSAHGYACPHFQILRVSMGKCFPRNSAMARAYAYAYAPRSIRRRGRREVVVVPPLPPQPPPKPAEPTFALPDMAGIWDAAADAETRARLIGIVKLREQLNR
jgi:hypothetical protein